MTDVLTKMPPIGDRLSALRDDIKAMQAYKVQPSLGLVKLDAMENPYRLPVHLQHALGERLGALALNRYPGDVLQELKLALAAHADLPEGFGMVVGNGSDELISMLAIAIDKPGSVVLAPVPGFVMYEVSARLQGLTYVGVDLAPNFDLDVAKMLAAIAQYRPALVYLAYPNNPTANSWADEDIDVIVTAVGAVGGLVVIDEAYQPFASQTYLNRAIRHRHVLVLRTLSKFGLAGVRVGYLMGPAEIMEVIEKVRPPYNVSTLNASCALFALEHADQFNGQAQAIKASRDQLVLQLSALDGVEVFPSDANMILIRITGQGASCSADAVFASMLEKGVLVKNVSKMHQLLHNCLRITVGTQEENTQMLLALEASL